MIGHRLSPYPHRDRLAPLYKMGSCECGQRFDWYDLHREHNIHLEQIKKVAL